MASKAIHIRTPDGNCGAYVAVPAVGGPFPAVLHAMADRIAAAGFYVLLPNLFYRHRLDSLPVGPQIRELAQSLTPEPVLRDAGAFLEFLHAQPGVKPGGKLGLTGYCMGGSMVVRTAAHFPDRVAVAASFHADQDPDMPPAQIDALQAALQAAGVRFQAELYHGARHGFTMPDLPVYDAPACEKHWQRLRALLGKLLDGSIEPHVG
jgi:carboxymethylenebutenolidase